MAELPTFDDVLDAAELLDGVAVRTPLLRSDALDEACGGKVLVKAECLQRTGSFKFRGAYNNISRLTPEQRAAASSPSPPATTPRAWRSPPGCSASRRSS